MEYPTMNRKPWKKPSIGYKSTLTIFRKPPFFHMIISYSPIWFQIIIHIPYDSIIHMIPYPYDSILLTIIHIPPLTIINHYQPLSPHPYPPFSAVHVAIIAQHQSSLPPAVVPQHGAKAAADPRELLLLIEVPSRLMMVNIWLIMGDHDG